MREKSIVLKKIGIYRPIKEEGDKKLNTFDHSLLEKWVWKIRYETVRLWYRVFACRYGGSRVFFKNVSEIVRRGGESFSI